SLRAKVHDAPEHRMETIEHLATLRRMATLFTKIIDGEIPGRFVWRDDRVVAFLTIAPLAPGHVLVVPIEEVDHWVDLNPDLLAHLMHVSQTVGIAVDQAFSPEKVGLMIAGLEVPHVHVHIVPMDTVRDLDFANADPNATAESLDDAARRIRAALDTGRPGPVAD
ncbi:MAG: HIT family protein, partial [Actinomycetota bacterium]|nr:HIT family protein [Actinomycetota bacterium]